MKDVLYRSAKKVNLLQCPVFLWHVTEQSTSQNQFTGLPLSASELVQLSLNSTSLRLRFSNSLDGDDPAHSFQISFFENRNLLGDGVKNHVVSTSTKDSICHFEGVNKKGEHSSLSACSINVISGLLRYGKNTFILSHSGSSFSLIPQNGDSCDWSHSVWKRSIDGFDPNIPSYYKNYLDGIKRHVELAFIADHSIYLKYDKDEKKIHDRLQSIASVVNSLYSPLNIRVTLVYADIWAKADVFEVTSVADKTLSQFVAYRKALLNEHQHDNAHLITDTRFGEVIGKAYKGTMCSYDFSGGVIVDHSENSAFVGGTVAHEMGHNFGMEHDAGYPEPCKCSGYSCIMSPSSSNLNSTTYFSDCSLEYLEHALKRGVDYCLHNVPKAAFGGSKCGNGILEPGEECDCGSIVSCPNKCCIASECKLAKDALCADGDCCDHDTCKPKVATKVCRESTNSCDLPEYCDGENPSCPADFFVQNGLTCPDDPDSFCYEGMCGSRDQQCKFIWGSTGKNSAPECYAFNKYGTLSGNCGYDREAERYIPCKQSNVDCGRLQCQHLSEKPVFGDPSTIHSAYNFVRLSTGQEAACRVIRTTYTGGKRKPDPGMVPDGAKCGKDKLCLGAECKNHSEVVQMVSKCEPVHCNQKGICNNVGNCHCQNGYGGVGCDIPGYGGSVNSGPANDQVFNPGVVLLYLFVIGLILFCVATFYCKRKKQFWLHKKIWKYVRQSLKIQSVLVPVRKAPPVPGAPIQHPFRLSFNALWGDSSAEVNQVIVRPTISSTMVPAKVTLVEQAIPKPSKNVTLPIHQNIVNKHPATVNPNKHHHQRKVSSGKGVPHNNSSKQEHRALKAESSSDEHPFESDFSIRNVATGQVQQAPTEYVQSTPPPPPPHKHVFGKTNEKKEAPAPPKKKSKEAAPPGLMTREVTPPKPVVKDKPKLPNKPPVAAKKILDEKSLANDNGATVNVKTLAARFNTKN